MLSGAAPSARKIYRSAWSQLPYFMSMRARSTRLVNNGPNWDEDLIDFIMSESHAMKNTSGAVRGGISPSAFGARSAV